MGFWLNERVFKDYAHGNEMIQDDAKSIVLWWFDYKFGPYYDDTIILMFFKLMPHV
jgi:hypothetical protein